MPEGEALDPEMFNALPPVNPLYTALILYKLSIVPSTLAKLMPLFCTRMSPGEKVTEKGYIISNALPSNNNDLARPTVEKYVILLKLLI